MKSSQVSINAAIEYKFEKRPRAVEQEKQGLYFPFHHHSYRQTIPAHPIPSYCLPSRDPSIINHTVSPVV